MDRAVVFAGGLNGLAWIARLEEMIAAVFERPAGQVPQAVIVFDDEDRFRPGRQIEMLGHLGFRARDAVHDAGKVDLEARAFARLAVHPDISTALLDDAVDGRQPEAGSLAGPFRREERLEDVMARLEGHA